jgi:hypothetical protein
MSTPQGDVRSVSSRKVSPEKENVARRFHGVHTAMLIIHGVGEQNPYETLDRFTRGVCTYISKYIWKNAELTPIEIAHKDWTQVGMRIAAKPGDAVSSAVNKDLPVEAQAPDKFVDVFEYYWAPQTEDKLSAVQTLKWALWTDFTPLHNIADDLQEILSANAQPEGDAKKKGFAVSLLEALKLYFVEFRRIFFVFIPLALALVGLLYWLQQGESRTKALKDVGTDLLTGLKDALHSSPLQLLAGALYLAGLLVAWFLFQFVKEWHDYPADSVENYGDRLWITMSAVTMTILLLLGRVSENISHGAVLAHVSGFVQRHWLLLAEIGLSYFTSYALTAYAADVAVYVNADAKSKSYVARNAILKGSTDALKALLTDPKYDRVILGGHSLGSVIAYDTINDLLAEVNAGAGPPGDQPGIKLAGSDLQKLRGLVTFGCPLDKIYYFFREQVKRDQAIRAQILSMLHSFRRKPSGRDYGAFRFQYDFAQLDGLCWLNAWSRMDPVSSQLDFYLPCHQECFPYKVPVWAHSSYWSDPVFYDYFCSKLL